MKSSMFKMTRPSLTERSYSANIILFLDSQNGVDIYKNRWGPHGKVTTKELIVILATILTEHLFNGRMKLFQAGVQTKIETAINKIIEREKHDTIQ